MTNAPKGARRKRKAGPREQISDDGYPCSPYPHPLLPQHELFVAHYLSHFNGTRAAREAGFTKHSAHDAAYKILNRVEVRAEINRRRLATSERIGEVTRERFEREVARVALSNMQDFAPMFGEGTPSEKLANLTRDQAACVGEITVEEFRDGRSDHRTVRRTKFKLVSKEKGLELLGRAKGWVQDRVDHKHDHRHEHTILGALLVDIAAKAEGQPIIDLTGQEVATPLIEDSSDAA